MQFFYCMPIPLTYILFIGHTNFSCFRLIGVITCKYTCLLQTLSVSNTHKQFLCSLGIGPNLVHMCPLQSLLELSLTHINAYALINESIIQLMYIYAFLQINYLSLAHTEFCIIYMPYTASFGSACSTYSNSFVYLFYRFWVH